MTPRRVAYVVSTFPKISETFIIGELAELCRREVDVRVLSLQTPAEAICHDSVHEARLLERTTYRREEFRRVIQGFDPDLVHAHFATGPTAAARCLAAERGLPFTFTAHGYDVYRRPPADFATRAAAAAGVITVSRANSRYITETFGVAAGHIHVIPCGVDTAWFTPVEEEGGTPLIVCVARLREVKQLDLLLHACAILRDRGAAFRCAIVGEGPEQASLERLRRQLRLDDTVAMPGAAEQYEVRRWWQRASVAVLSSLSEGMPVSLMEAAACGVPGVAPAVGGIPELIADGVTGFVTPPGDVQSFVAALQLLLIDKALRTRMGMAARRRAVAQFSRTRQVDQLLALWSGLLH